MNQSSCLCGAVSWQTDGPYEFMSHCHCARCRKAHGAAFATYFMVPPERLRLAGAEYVARFEAASAGFARCFCGRCGSVVPGDPFDGQTFVPAGNLLDDPVQRPQMHIFVASKAPWYDIVDPLPRFDAYPPGVDAPVVADRPPVDPGGAPRGSCLCGGVTYVVEGKPLRAMNCHCWRCRAARSAAHASNLFTNADGVRFTRGADLLASYKLPDARYFMQVFCHTCGSPAPRVDRDRDLAVVPMGGLDDDAGLRPQAHIFVGSKAPWFEIADALPQHQAAPG
ncbi:MAG: GFA family protein [Myxococcota bacterium]